MSLIPIYHSPKLTAEVITGSPLINSFTAHVGIVFSMDAQCTFIHRVRFLHRQAPLNSEELEEELQKYANLITQLSGHAIAYKSYHIYDAAYGDGYVVDNRSMPPSDPDPANRPLTGGRL